MNSKTYQRNLLCGCVILLFLLSMNCGTKTHDTPQESSQEGSQESSQGEAKGRISGPARRSTVGLWTTEEDEVLREAVKRYNGKNWKKIAELFNDRTEIQCLHRWHKVLNPKIVKGTWTQEEDNNLIDLVKRYGPTKWSTISKQIPGRMGKQCRERWHNHLDPAINRNAWTREEELILVREHKIHGNKWAELMRFLPGRSANAIKNHWNSSVKKKLDSYAPDLVDQGQSSPLIALQNKSIASSSSCIDSIGDEGSLPWVDAEGDEGDSLQCVDDEGDEGNSCPWVDAEGNLRPWVDAEGNSWTWVVAEGDEGNSWPRVDAEESEPNQASTVFSQSTNDLQDEVIPGNDQGAEQQISNALSHEEHSLPTSNTDPGAQTLRTDEECFRILLPGTSSGGHGWNIIDPQNSKSSLCSQSAETHVNETGKLPPLSWHRSSSEGLADHIFVPFLDSDVKEVLLLLNDSNVPTQGSPLFGASELETDTNDGCIDIDEYVTSHGNDDDDGIQEHQGLSYPLNSYSSPTRVKKIHFVMDDKPAETDLGALSPSVANPFYSCDLIPTKSDLGLAFSPFGLRQMRMWDTYRSPSHNRSADVMLPDNVRSILKKHDRDMQSSELDRSKDKKLKRAVTSSWAKDEDIITIDDEEEEEQKETDTSEST